VEQPVIAANSPPVATTWLKYLRDRSKRPKNIAKRWEYLRWAAILRVVLPAEYGLSSKSHRQESQAESMKTVDCEEIDEIPY